MNIASSDFQKNEPYHEIVVTIYNNNDKIINETITNGFTDGNINVLVWINLLSVLIESVEKFKNTSGPLKKRIVLEICLISIDKNSKLSDKHNYLLKTSLNKVLPQLIDTIVNVSNKINLNKNKLGKFIKKIFSCICSQKISDPKQDIIIQEPVEPSESRNSPGHSIAVEEQPEPPLPEEEKKQE